MTSDGVKLRWRPELIGPTGMIDGGAAGRTLGKPDLPFWDVFLRESLQNSWDARTGESIDFEVVAQEFSAEGMARLQREVFSDDLPTDHDPISARLSDEVQTGRLRALIVRDSGTVGLTGPPRADTAVPPETPTHFRSFVFDIGHGDKPKIAGGSYGFGKAVFYTASRARTCMIYTRTRVGEEIVDRFIATRVGPGFNSETSRYTGRFWWGVPDGDAVLPLEGEAAVRLASELGMLTIAGSTGTVIAVLDPGDPSTDTDESLGEIVDAVRGAALRWAWPHLVSADGEPSIRFSFRVGGEGRPLSLDDDSEIKQFVAAYRDALNFQADSKTDIAWQARAHRVPLDDNRPTTGVLVVRRAQQPETIEPRLNNRVALLRGPRFVVKYLSVRADPQGQYVAGVFLADPLMESAFAAAEPVTHDNWARENGALKHRPVAWTLDSIEKIVANRLEAEDPLAGEDVPIGGVAHLSRVIAETLVGLTGTGAERQRTVMRDGGGSRSPVGVVISGDPVPVSLDGTRVTAHFPVQYRLGASSSTVGWSVQAKPRVVAEAGGTEAANDVDARIVEWVLPDDSRVQGSEIRAEEMQNGEGFVIIEHPVDVAVTLQFSKEKS